MTLDIYPREYEITSNVMGILFYFILPTLGYYELREIEFGLPLQTGIFFFFVFASVHPVLQQ